MQISLTSFSKQMQARMPKRTEIVWIFCVCSAHKTRRAHSWAVYFKLKVVALCSFKYSIRNVCDVPDAWRCCWIFHLSKPSLRKQNLKVQWHIHCAERQTYIYLYMLTFCIKRVSQFTRKSRRGFLDLEHEQNWLHSGPLVFNLAFFLIRPNSVNLWHFDAHLRDSIIPARIRKIFKTAFW